jgi:predicted  nucleic acid-binding Zn-ribbon protein
MTKKILPGILLLVLSGSGAFAEDKMTRDEYDAKLSEYKDRQATADAQIAQLDGDIAELNNQIGALGKEISGLKADIRSMVDATESEINAFGKNLDRLLRQLDGLTALAPEELVRHQGEIERVQDQVDAAKKNKIAAIPEMASKIRRIESLISDLQIRDVISISYEVKKGDHLWGIASDETIYGDPYMWPRIYRSNSDKIQDPDLIYPQQNLSVPFGVSEGQYLVTGGDFLSKIAAAVYNDASKWHQIYEANKNQIVEPSLIFPAQVLEVPTN